HVLADLLEDFGEGHGRSFVFEHLDGLVGLDDDLLLLIGELDAALLVLVRRLLVGLGLDGLVQILGAVKDADLHGQHLFTAGLQGGQEALQLLFAGLAQQLFELLAGLFQLLDRVLLVVGGRLVLVLGDVIFGLVLLVVGVLNLLAAV